MTAKTEHTYDVFISYAHADQDWVRGELLARLEEAGLRSKIKVLVGGAPVTRSWADEIGADGYSEDAIGAVAVAKKLVGA